MGSKGEKPLPPPPSTVAHYTITPDDIPRILNAEACHKEGITGDDVVVGIVDSGWYDHAYFGIAKQEFRAKHAKFAWKGSGSAWNAPRIVFPTVGRPLLGDLPNPEDDTSDVSHGTGMVANLLAVAPGVTLRMYSRDQQSFLESLEAAVEQCEIVSISKSHDPATWGRGDHVKALIERYRAVFVRAKERDRIVFHASGNTGSLPWPVANANGCLVRVGGVHQRRDGSREASDYAMAHGKDLLPDICGLCGMAPDGAYIWLPSDPDRDRQTAYAKGWGLHSGTSSATPQVAGVCALMAQARKEAGKPPLSTDQARAILRKSATPVTLGKSADGFAANADWTLLVNADAAVKAAVA